MQFSDCSGYGCSDRRLLEHDRDSEQEYIHDSHFTYQQPSEQKYSEEMCKISPINEQQKNQQADPPEEGSKRRVEIQTKTEPERKRIETFGKQQKENGDYFCPGKVRESEEPARSKLCSNCNHNFASNCKSDSEEMHVDGFQASIKTDLEPAAKRILLPRCGGDDDKARMYCGGHSRLTTFLLAKCNTLKPPASVQNCVAATYDLLRVCSDLPSSEGDIEPGLLHL